MLIEMRGGFVGMNAEVYCNCWKDGKTTDPPVPHEWVAVDEDGNVWMDNPAWRPWPKGGPEYECAMAADNAFDSWKEHGACAHEDMCLARVWVSNIGGLAAFRQALRMAGEDRFKTVLAAVCWENDGSPETASRMLAELDAFMALDGYGSVAVLVDEDTGEELWQAAAEACTFIQGSGKERLNWYLDERGVTIAGKKTVREVRSFGPIKLAINRTKRDVVFRSLRFTQHPTDAGVEYRDLDTGTVFISRMAIGDQNPPHARRFQVGFKQENPAEYAHEVEALKTVCRASVTSGNLIVWR